MPSRKLTPLSPAERAEVIQRIRFELGIQRGRKVTLAEFAELVSEIGDLDRPISHATVIGWEKGAEPGFLAGCAIAHLGGLPAEALAFKQTGGSSRPASEVYPEARPVPFKPATKPDDRAVPAKGKKKGA